MSTDAQSFYLIFTFLERTGFESQSVITVMSVLHPVHVTQSIFLLSSQSVIRSPQSAFYTDLCGAPFCLSSLPSSSTI